MAIEVKKFNPDSPKRIGLVVLYYGEPGSGKTFNAASFPGPILFLDTERRCELAISSRIQQGMDSREKEFHIASVDTMADCREAITSFSNIVSSTSPAHSGEAPTIVLDSATSLQKFAEEEYLRKTNKDSIFPQFAWGEVYSIIDEFLVNVRKNGMNLVFTCMMKDEYAGDTKTGRRVMDVYKKMKYWVDVIVGCSYDYDTKSFSTVVVKNGYGHDQYMKIEPGFDNLLGSIMPYMAPATATT